MSEIVEAAETSREPCEIAVNQDNGWVSGHLYYHQDLDRVVRGFVQPLITMLAKGALITGFFFIRHGLGGPHVRLRLRPAAGAEERVFISMQRFAHSFLAREPSTRSLDGDAVRWANAAMLENDPHEVDDSVYPDNSFRVQVFRPEIERYGGPSRFRLSLDYFTLSSVAVIDHLLRSEDTRRSVQLTQAYELLLRQALGFAVDEIELADLLRYGVDWLGWDLPKVVVKGDQVARSQKALFLGLFRKGLTDVLALRASSDTADPSPPSLLVVGAARLSEAIGTADRESRVRIGASQLHMTASRLGITNAEEVYLSRLLSITLSEVSATGEDDLSWIQKTALTTTSRDPATAVRELLPHAFAALANRSSVR